MAAALAPFLHGQEAESAETIPQESAAPADVPTTIPEEAPAPDAAEAVPAETVPATDASSSENVPEEAVPAEAPKKAPARLTADQKKQLEIRLLNARKARIDAEIALERARLGEQLAARNAERSRLETETALRAARTAAKLSDIDADKRKLDAVLARDKVRGELERAERENKLRAAEIDVKIAQCEQGLALARGERKVAQVQAAETLRGIAPSDASAPAKDPLADGVLRVSDRRIELNGVVTPELADYVCSRIYFYNNQSAEYPIFIVIDSSPGGSVAAGYQILKAMESSRAPVYVVVKSYAASMAAVITTSAERSFCYAGTVILHHQPSTGTKGNLTQLRESLELVTAWTRRINEKIAAKMGLSYEEYVAAMYKHNSRGDWSEFGEGARELHWVTDVVEAIDEAGIVRKDAADPAGKSPRGGIELKTDERGRPYVELPALPSGDAWMVHDPRNFYRVAP